MLENKNNTSQFPLVIANIYALDFPWILLLQHISFARVIFMAGKHRLHIAFIVFQLVRCFIRFIFHGAGALINIMAIFFVYFYAFAVLLSTYKHPATMDKSDIVISNERK